MCMYNAQVKTCSMSQLVKNTLDRLQTTIVMVVVVY